MNCGPFEFSKFMAGTYPSWQEKQGFSVIKVAGKAKLLTCHGAPTQILGRAQSNMGEEFQTFCWQSAVMPR